MTDKGKSENRDRDEARIQELAKEIGKQYEADQTRPVGWRTPRL